MSALTEALGYVECRGWMIFPVPPGTKRSYKSARFSGGRPWGMSGDPMEIERDFRRWPDAGVGIPTGEVNRIFVLEADTVEGHGVDGLAALKTLEAKHAPLPETLMAQSPSGSIHRYFNWPGAKIKNSDGKLAPGVDVKGDGGMVVAPPTRTQKGVYRWLNDLPIADAPDWLLRLAGSRRALPVFDRLARRAAGAPRNANRKPVKDAELRRLMASIPNGDETRLGRLEPDRYGAVCRHQMGRTSASSCSTLVAKTGGQMRPRRHQAEVGEIQNFATGSHRYRHPVL